MQMGTQKCWQAFWLVVCFALAGLWPARAALVDLDAYVSFSIYDESGNTPLADGSVVYIIGSGNATVDPMSNSGTNLIAYSTTGDDVILGYATIGGTGSNGTFFTTVQYDDTFVNYVYIRFFDFTNDPYDIQGMVYWGQSSNFFLGPPTLGVSTVNFNPDATLVTSNYNNFIAVPEPNTANLLVLVAGMGWAMRASMKGRRKDEKKKQGEKPGDHPQGGAA